MDIVEILDRYSAGDEFQRPVEEAIDEITTLRQRVQELTAERDKVTQYWQIAEGRCDALKQQRDELLWMLEKVTAKLAWLNSDDCGHIMALTDESESLIASVKEK